MVSILIILILFDQTNWFIFSKIIGLMILFENHLHGMWIRPNLEIAALFHHLFGGMKSVATFQMSESASATNFHDECTNAMRNVT